MQVMEHVHFLHFYDEKGSRLAYIYNSCEFCMVCKLKTCVELVVIISRLIDVVFSLLFGGTHGE